MFNIKLNDARILSNSMAVISDFITEATFSIEKEGIRLIAMDPANISMVILNILPSAFTEYNVQEKSELTLNLENLKNALKRVKADETLELSQDQNKLNVIIKGKSTRKFSIPLLEKESKERKVPELSFNAIVDVDASEFREYIDDVSAIADAVSFEVEEETFKLNAGDTGSKVNIALPKESLINLESKAPSKSIYSVEYLKKMSKASSLAEAVKIQFSKDYPLKLDFTALDKAQMSFILAPRIENT